MSVLQIRRLGNTRDQLGESPYWDGATHSLGWVDGLAATLHRYWPDSGRHEAHSLPAPVGSVAPCRSGAVVVALHHTLARLDLATGAQQTLATLVLDHPQLRLNDAKCDPWGQLLVGSMHSGRRPDEPALGALYRLRCDGVVEMLADGFGVTNGPCFSPDGATLYLADTPARTLWAWDYTPDGPLTGRREWAQTEALGSGPDGATVDAAGFLWTPLVRTGQLARFAPDGQLDRLLDLPATHPTSLCIGGTDLRTAYITSISRSTHLVGDRPDDGGLFELRGLPVPGLPAQRFDDRFWAGAAQSG
jgi:L-arabinonolactonase